MLRWLTENEAETRPGHPDPKLRGRVYAIPFDRVWNEALSLARATRGWSVTGEDDREGIIEVEARTRILRVLGDVQVRVSLDPDAQTRVDLSAASRSGRGDLGRNRRRILRFLRNLDQNLGVTGP